MLSKISFIIAVICLIGLIVLFKYADSNIDKAIDIQKQDYSNNLVRIDALENDMKYLFR